MELEVGIYIRSKINGTIGKITDIEDIKVSNGNITIKNGKRYILDNNYNRGFCETEQDSVIASYNIIDLIECLDIVELYIVGLEEDNITKIIRPETLNELKELKKHIKNGAKIKSITTREMFESMNYKVDDAK